MKQLRALFVLLLLLIAAAAALFGIQTLALPKMVMSVIAVLLTLAVAAVVRPLVEESSRVENEEPEQGFS